MHAVADKSKVKNRAVGHLNPKPAAIVGLSVLMVSPGSGLTCDLSTANLAKNALTRWNRVYNWSTDTSIINFNIE